MVDIMSKEAGGKRAKVFWTGRSQAVRLPREFRFEGCEVRIRRQGRTVVLEPVDEWPEDYWASFAGISGAFERPSQGEVDAREELE